MACFSCCRLPQEEEKKPLIIDVQQILKDEAWDTFICSLGYCRRKCTKRSKFKIDVPENYFVFDQVGQPKFEHIAQWNPNDPMPLEGCNGVENQQKPDDVNQDETNRKDNSKETDFDKLGEIVSMDTTFSNDTAEKQTYQFKYSKTRSSRLEVSYQKGFTIGGKTNFSIGLPKALANCSFGLAAEGRLEMRESRCQVFENSVTMEATSDITVGPKSKYVAKVQLEERTLHSKFTVRIRMSLPQGRAPIYIRRISDDVVVYVFGVKNLPDIFAQGDSGNSSRFSCVEKVEEGGKLLPDKIDFLVEGIIKGNLACDHNINLTSNETEQQKIQAKNTHLQT